MSIIALIFSFQYTNQPSQSQTQAIVTALIVDLNEQNKVEVGAVVVTPVQNSYTKHFAYTGEGETISRAIQSISLQLGKEMGFGQCDVMALGDKICEENAMKVLDYLTRTKRVGKNSILLNFEGDLEQFSNSVVYMMDNLSLPIGDIIDYNQRNTMASETNVEAFLKSFYGDTGLSKMPKLSVQKEQTTNSIKIDLSSSPSSAGGTGEGKSSGESEENGKEKNEVYFINNGTTSIFKNGKKVLEYSPKDMVYINLLDKKSVNGEFTLKNINSEIYNNASLEIRLRDKKVNAKYDFDNNQPYINYELKLYIDIEEVVEEGKNVELLKSENWFVDDAVVKALKELIITNLEASITKIKTNFTDVLNIYEPFNKFHYKKWKNFTKNTENYLQGVNFKFDIKIYSDY